MCDRTRAFIILLISILIFNGFCFRLDHQMLQVIFISDTLFGKFPQIRMNNLRYYVLISKAIDCSTPSTIPTSPAAAKTVCGPRQPQCCTIPLASQAVLCHPVGTYEWPLAAYKSQNLWENIFEFGNIFFNFEFTSFQAAINQAATIQVGYIKSRRQRSELSIKYTSKTQMRSNNITCITLMLFDWKKKLVIQNNFAKINV